MTLESEIVALTGEVTKMLGKIDLSRQEALTEVFTLSRSLPYQYKVTTVLGNFRDHDTSSGLIKSTQTLKEIMALIASERRGLAEPTGVFEQFSLPVPVTIYMDSFKDSLPLLVTEPNVEIVMTKSVVFKIQPGFHGIIVSARDVTLTGGTYVFEKRNPQNISIKSDRSLRTEVRAAKLINHDASGLSGIDAQSLDLISFDV